MDKARKLAFIKDLGQALVSHLENEPNSKIQDRLIRGFEELYQSALTTDKTPNLKKGKEQTTLIHDPKKIVWYLKKFTEDTHIKYAVHLWDGVDAKGYKNYHQFIERLIEDFKVYEFTKMTKYNPQLFWHLIFPFVFQKKLSVKKEDNSEIPFKWGRYKLKVGWQYPNNVLHPEPKSTNNKKPHEIKIPKDLRPIELIQGKQLIYFKDFIDVFKKEIEFRRSDFEFLIRKITHDLSDFKVNIKGLKGLSFYTYTLKIENALKRFFKNMDTNFPNIQVEGKLGKDDTIIIEILQIDSYCDKSLNDAKINLLEGEFKTIQENLISLCDWSIQSRFRDGKFYEFKYLDVNNESNFTPIHREIPEDPRGFKHILTFY